MRQAVKTGSLVILLLLAWYSGTNSMAQGVTFEAKAPNVLRAGEQFQLVYSLNARSMIFRHPILVNSGFWEVHRQVPALPSLLLTDGHRRYRLIHSRTTWKHLQMVVPTLLILQQQPIRKILFPRIHLR